MKRNYLTPHMDFLVMTTSNDILQQSANSNLAGILDIEKDVVDAIEWKY